ncbi:MAG: SufD family Fe-S cluster assembly protein [Myxococcota bacterium]
MSTPDVLARDAYQAAFAALQERLPGFSDARSTAAAALDFPVRRSEAWRFTQARNLLQTTYTPRGQALGPLPEGVLSLDELPASVAQHLLSVAPTTGFAGLNAAFFTEVAGLHSAAGTSRQVELTLTHRELSVPRVLVVAEAGSSLELLVRHDVLDGLAVPVIEIVAHPTSRVSLTHVVHDRGGHFAGVVAGSLTGSTVALQSVFSRASDGIARLDVAVDLGEGSRFDSSGLVLGRGRSHTDHHLAIAHSGHRAVSTQQFRNILDERSRAVFTGEVHVQRGVTGSDATQSANTLLLSDDASAVARPWLVIDNDDVKAAHGATVGRIDPDALFYLRARGIGALEAQRLLTGAFAGEVVETVPEAFREAVRAVVDAYLEGAA